MVMFCFLYSSVLPLELLMTSEHIARPATELPAVTAPQGHEHLLKQFHSMTIQVLLRTPCIKIGSQLETAMNMESENLEEESWLY